MLTNEKQKTLSWQIKTKEGMYYQPDSLSIVYQWIIENRISVDDLIFSAKENDWVSIINMPELKNCFWQLLTNANIVYGPISLGEMRQLYINNQISSIDKVSFFGKEGWKKIDELPMLSEWLKSLEVPEIDFVTFIEKLEKEFELSQKAPKEVKIRRKIEEIEKQNVENVKYIKELETTKLQIEEVLENTNKEKEKMISERVQLDSKLESLQEEIKNLQIVAQEKQGLLEELNKHIAQAEVTGTLKDDQMNQLRSSIISLQEELEKTKRENEELQQSLPEVIKDLRVELEELDTAISIKETEIEAYKGEIQKLEGEIINKDRLLEEAKESIKDLDTIVNKQKEEIQETVSNKGKEIDGYRESIARLQGELAEKNREMAGFEELKGEVNNYKQRIEELDNTISEKERILIELKTDVERFREEIKIREDTISELKNNLEALKEEYNAKVKEWEEAVVIQKKELQDELSEKTRQWEKVLKNESEKWEGTRQDLEGNLAQKEAQIENQKIEITRLQDAIILQDEKWQGRFKGAKEESDRAYKEIERERDGIRLELDERTRQWEKVLADERGKWEGTRQDLEGNLAQREAQIESQQLEITRLQDAIISQDERWQGRFKEAKEESDRVYKELERERDELRIELTQKINELVSERDTLQISLTEIEKLHKGIVQDKEILQKELLAREKFIESIKNEAKRQDGVYKDQIRDMEQRLSDANGEIEGLHNKVQELNKDLDSTKQIINQIQQEKEEFTQIKSKLESELEESKRNLEHAEEENRSLQKQFYLEKQKLTKEYNETINKLDKLQKRGQLEREIQDSTRMKEELERLYNLLKENFSGLQRGAEDVQSSLQALNTDIDNKRLSLKYLTETEKRIEKKGPFSKAEPAEES